MLRLKLEKFLFLCCLIFLPTQLGKHFWPTFSTIYSLPIDYLAPTFYFWDLLTLLLITVWLFGQPRINWRAVNLFLLFILTLAVSGLAAVNPGATLVELYHLTIVGLFGVYLASQPRTILNKSFLISLLIGLFVSVALALGQFLTQHSLNFWLLGERTFDVTTPAIATFDFKGQVFLRPYATFPHPNALAGYLVLLLPLLWWLTKTPVARWLVIAIISGATLLTFSRTATAVLFVELLFILRQRLRYLVVLVLILLPFLWVRFGALFNFDNLSVVRREDLAGTALLFFKQSPIWGIGLNNFINLTATTNLIAGPNRFLQPVHNIFLLILAEAGLLGVLGLLGLFGGAIIKLYRQRQKTLARVLLACWLIIFFLGSLDHYLLTLPQGQRLLFLVWGLSMLEY